MNNMTVDLNSNVLLTYFVLAAIIVQQCNNNLRLRMLFGQTALAAY